MNTFYPQHQHNVYIDLLNHTLLSLLCNKVVKALIALHKISFKTMHSVEISLFVAVPVPFLKIFKLV